MHRETKATAIPPKVKAEVLQRDFGRCVLCGNHNAGPHCHYIRRSHGGLGIPKNIWTGCQRCHEAFDSEASDGPLHQKVKAYLQGWYPDWDETQLIYKKYGGI
uniref:Endonuclease n=1 Tax=Dulem virus 33 TaxID=3145751 RepID=A0AAU8B5F9_9CAUD